MTLKSNKNESAAVLERVNSARTALSDLYLEQLLQNKPKTDQVRPGFRLESFRVTIWFLQGEISNSKCSPGFLKYQKFNCCIATKPNGCFVINMSCCSFINVINEVIMLHYIYQHHCVKRAQAWCARVYRVALNCGVFNMTEHYVPFICFYTFNNPLKFWSHILPKTET